MTIDWNALKERLRVAIEQVEDAKRRQAWDELTPAIAKVCLRARRLGPNPAAERAITSLRSAFANPPPFGDAHALKRTAIELRSEGVPCIAMAKSLTKLGYCKGKELTDLDRCAVRVRQMLARQRLGRARPA